MAMVKLRGSCASAMFRCMKSQYQTKAKSKLEYPSWQNQEDMVIHPTVCWKRSSSTEESESELKSYKSKSRARSFPKSLRDAGFVCQPKLAPWKERVEFMNSLPPAERFDKPGLDYHHWRVYLKPLKGLLTRDQFVNYYLHTMSLLFHSEEEASKTIYSMATKHYFAFGANISPEQADIITEFPNVILVYPDSYEDPRVKRYLWDSFVNGQVLSYDPEHYPTPSDEGEGSLSDEELRITGFRVPVRKYAKLPIKL